MAQSPIYLWGRSILERRFILYWGELEGPELCEELKFHPTNWRFDFAHESASRHRD